MDPQVPPSSPPSITKENISGDAGGDQRYVVPPVDSAEQEPGQEPLSKKARKKAAKAAYLASVKLERRAREKEARKRKKQAERERRMEQGEAGDGKSGAEASSGTGERRRKRRKLGQGEGEDEGVNVFGAKVVVDLGFDELMSEKEITSLTSQLAYTYSANRHAARPFSSLIFSSLGGRTRTRLDAMNDAGYRRWVGTEWWEEGYERLWTNGDTNKEQNTVEGGGPLGTPEMPEHPPENEATQEVDDVRASVVYLTADSMEELEELKEGETYIIGGICDHNRYKNLCLNKASESKIRHARLPIGRYIASLTTRKVLTVNQVLEILVKWVEGRDWEEAFWNVIPRRKFQNGTDRAEEDEGVDGGGAEEKVDDDHEVG